MQALFGIVMFIAAGFVTLNWNEFDDVKVSRATAGVTSSCKNQKKVLYQGRNSANDNICMLGRC